MRVSKMWRYDQIPDDNRKRDHDILVAIQYKIVKALFLYQGFPYFTQV